MMSFVRVGKCLKIIHYRNHNQRRVHGFHYSSFSVFLNENKNNALQKQLENPSEILHFADGSTLKSRKISLDKKFFPRPEIGILISADFAKSDFDKDETESDLRQSCHYISISDGKSLGNFNLFFSKLCDKLISFAFKTLSPKGVIRHRAKKMRNFHPNSNYPD